MSTPDLEQIKRWASGEEERPGYEELVAIAKAVGAERAERFQQYLDGSKRMEKLVPMLYPTWQNVADMADQLQVSRMTIEKYLNGAGFKKGTTRPKLLKEQAQPSEAA